MARLAPVGGGSARMPRRRLTRKGRLAVLLGAAAVLFAMFSLGRVSTQAATTSKPPALRHVVVQPGETLWQVAERAAPTSDTRIEVARIISLNGLAGASVEPGEELLLPPG
jgi:predicted Zn-dependent protease